MDTARDTDILGYRDTGMHEYIYAWPDIRKKRYRDKWIVDTRIQRFRDSGDRNMQGYMDTSIQEYRDSGTRRFMYTWIQGYSDSGIQGYRDLGVLRFRNTLIQGYRDLRIQKFRDTEI